MTTAILLASIAAAGTSTQIANKPLADNLGGGSSGVYRIPAMAKSTNGVIVAESDCRYNSSGDLPNAIDIVEVWSGDNGATWSRPRIGIDVPNTNNYEKACNIGDPCIVYDPVGNRFWLMAITGGGLASSHVDGVSVADVVMYTRGTGENDAWQEWTGGPAGNTRSVKQMILDSLAEAEGNETLRDEDQIRGILQGPGHGIAQRQTVFASDGETVLMPKDALVFPMQYFRSKSSFSDSFAFAVYSTDGGITWKSTKLAPTQKSQESCIMELDDGSWVMMAKCQSGGERYFFRTTDYLNWTKYDSLTPSAGCQGSCLWLGKGTDGKSRYVSCFATGSDRSNITLHFGTDNSSDKDSLGIIWDSSLKSVIHEGSVGGAYAYNSLIMVDEHTLGVLLETFGHITFCAEDVSEVLAKEIRFEVPDPVAVWNGDFTKMQSGYSLEINGNRLSDDNSTITITNTYAGLDINAASSFANGVTLLVRYSNLVKGNNAKVLATSCNDSGYAKDRTGVDLQPDDKLWGMWYDNGWSDNGNRSAAGVMPATGVFAFTYERTSGTYLYAGTSTAQISSTSAFGASGLKSKNDTIWGVTVGGMRSGTTNANWRAAQDMDVSAIAVFDKVLSVEEMNAYKWPARVLFSNTNATPDVASWTVPGTPKITIPEGLTPGLTKGQFLKVASLDFGCHSDSQGCTHARKIAIKSGNTVWTSANVVTNSIDTFPGKNNGTVPRLVYSFEGTNCIIAVGTPYEISLLDGSGAPLTNVRYALAKDADKIISGMDFNASYTPMMQLIGDVLSNEEAEFAESFFDWTPGSAPTGWFTAWKGENGGSPKTVVGPDGTARTIQVTYRNGSNDTWTPYCSDAAHPLTNFTFITYGSADMVTADNGKYAVLWCMGQKDNAKTALVKDSDGNICLVQITGAQVAPARTITAGPVKGYHVFTVRFNQASGASLQIDDGQIEADSDFTTVAYAGFQVGSVRGGCNGPLDVGQGFAVLKMLAFPTNAIPEVQYAALCEQYPAVAAMNALEYNVAGSSLYLPSLVLSSGQLRIKSGTLEVPVGVEASLSALEFGDVQGNPSFGMNLAGRITINTSSSGANNNYNSAYGDCNSGRGVNLGEWTGTGTHNITGSFVASNTIVEVCHDSSSVTTTIDGGELVVKGITAKDANRASLVLTGGGTLNLGQYPSCNVAIGKMYGLGTVTGTASWTDTDDIVFNGTGETGTTILADGIHLKFTGNLSGNGKVTIKTLNGGSVTFGQESFVGEISVEDGSVFYMPDGYRYGYNPSDDEITHECFLRISEIMPKPTDARNRGALEGMDVNGLESGWVEVENTSDKWADLADYRFIRVNRGKKTDPAGVGNFPSRLVPPHGRAIFYTSERYSNSKDKAVSAFAEGTFDGKPMIFENYGNILVWGDKVNPKKSPYVRLYYAPGGDSDKGTVVDTVVVPSDLPEGWSIIVGDAAEGEGTRRWMCPTPTRGSANAATSGLTRIGPNVGPLYEKKGQKKTDFANEFAAPVPPAVPGTDYTVTLPVNAVMNSDGTFTPRAADQIQSLKFVYRKDLDDTTLVTNDIAMATKTTDANWGDQYTATIPASYFPAAGHLMQWKVLITDGEGEEWTSPSFNNPDDGYEWYGTIVEPGELNSATLPTWHMFASGNHLTQMDVDKDDQNLSLVPNYARIAIYDSSTSNYYDYVRIDLRGHTSASFTKKGHGLRFAKAHPLTMVDSVTGETIEEIRKTSLISEFADPSFMRQMIAFWLFRKMGNHVPFDFPVRCNLNGEFYQLAFNSERFTDELIEDVYGLDKFGYGYKNVGTLNQSTTTAGSIEKKTPDDEDESNISVLTGSLISPLRQNGANSAHSSSESESLTKFVVQKFDLPAWLNYLASARITQEMDDVWANVCAYYDNPDMIEGARGTGTWMPLGYDFNLTFGQYYISDLESGALNGLSATNDWYKSHPLYGGWTVLAHKNTSGSSMNGNNGFEAVYQSAKFRRLYLRRLRTLMDQELKEPGTATNDTPFMVKMYEMADIMRTDSELDIAKWPNNYTDRNIDVWTMRPENMEAGIRDIWDNYVVPRREHLYVTHSVTNTAKAIGYGSNLNAGIPEAQSPIEDLKAGFTVDNTTDETMTAIDDSEKVVIRNSNAEAVDMSGWQLTGRFKMTLPAGAVVDADDTITVVIDRKAYIAAHDSELTNQVIIGNATINADSRTLLLTDADGVKVLQVAPPSDESLYLRLHSFDGIPPSPSDGDTDEWITLTNISETATLDLAGVRVVCCKTGDEVAKCDFTIQEGQIVPLGSITVRQSDYAAVGWTKITNGELTISIYDANGLVAHAGGVVQKNHKNYRGAGGPGGEFYIRLTQFEAEFASGDFEEVAYPVTTVEVVPGEDAALEAATQEEAEAALADCEIVLTAEDEQAGLVTNVLKLVAVPVVYADPLTGDETISYVARVDVDETKVSAPAIAEPETQDDKPVTLVDDEGGKTVVSARIGNAVVGLWYGYEVTDELGTAAVFGNDVGSFERATNATHTVTASPRTQPSGFFRVKAAASKPKSE